MALRLRSSAPGETVREEEKRTGRGRLAAAIGETETEPEEKEERQSGRDRLAAAIERAETPETPSAIPASTPPRVSNSYREVDTENGRIRTRPADLSTPRLQDDPEEMAAELNRLGTTIEDTGTRLGALSDQRTRANVAAQTYGSQVKAYETKLEMLNDTIANSEDPEERRRAQQEARALDLGYQKAQRAAERYGTRAAAINSEFEGLVNQYDTALQSYQALAPKYTRRLGLGETHADRLIRQAEEIRNRQRSLGAGLYQMTPEQQDEYWAMGKQVNDLERAAARERGNYAQYLYNTQGEEKANAYLSEAEAGNRAKAETNSFIGKVLNTAGGAALNFTSGVGSTLITMARIMELPEDALYWITGDERFNLDREPYLRNSTALQASDTFREEAERMKSNAGNLGSKIIDISYAAGNMMGASAFAGQALGAIGNSGAIANLESIANSSPLLTSSAARYGARLGAGVLKEIVSNPGNFGVAASSAVNNYSTALANGATFEQAMSNGMQKGVLEYLSNKMFSGTPFVDAPGQQGYVTKLIEYVAGKLGKSGALAKLNASTGGKVLNWFFDKSGEGLEEVITAIGDPLIDRITYDRDADLATADELVDEYIGGVLLSLLMTGGEKILSGPEALRENRRISDFLVDNWGMSKAEADKYAPKLRKAIQATEEANRAAAAIQRAEEADRRARGETTPAAEGAGITEAPEAAAAPVEAANENTPPVPGAVQENGPPVPQGVQIAPQAEQTAENAPPVPGEVRNAAETAGAVQETEAVPQAENRTETAASPTGRARLEAAMASEGQAVGEAAAQAPGEANAEAAGEKVTQRTLASERQKTAEKVASLRDAGFSTAGEDATARIRSEESWDAEEKAVGQALRDLGYEPTFAVGLIENAEGKSVPYLLEGNKLAVRSDHRNQSVQEIAEKAVGQALNIDQGVRNQVMETITQARAEAKAARQAAKTTAEKPKVSERAQATMESARTAGASEEDGALAGRLADIIGRDIRFFNEAGKDGAWKNGYTQNGVIYINAQAKKPVAWVVGHELTHNVEHSKIYDSLKKLAQKEMGINWGLRVQSRLDASARIAQKLGDDSVRLTDPADAEREIVADFFADRLLSDEAAIRKVCEYEPVTARNIRDYIKGLLRKLGGKETTLERALTLYNKALKDVAAKAQADAEGRMRLKGTEGARPKTAVESVKKYSLNVETIDYAVNYTARTEEAKEQLRLLQKDITELGDIQDRINKEAGGRAAKNIHDLNDYLQAHPDIWQRLWDMQQELNDAGIRCDFVTEPGSPNVIDERQVPGGLKGLPIEYVESTTGKRYKFTAFWRNMPQMLLDSMSHDSREKLRTEIMKGVEDAYSRKTGERDLLPYFKDQFPSTKEIEKVAGDRTIKNIRNQTQSRVQSPIRDAEKTVAALNLNSACPMFTIGNNGCYLDACYLTQMANGATGTNLFRSAWYTGELLQISDADIRRMNELGGLRVNGVGDTTMDNKSQLKDALRHAGMRGLKVKMITKQRASLEVLAEMHEEGTDVSHVTVQPSMDNLWIPAKLDDVYGAGVRGTTQLAKTVEAGRNEAAATGYEEMFGRATKVVDGTLYRKYGFTPEQIREMQEDFPFVNITPRYVVCTAAEIAEIALNRNGEYVNGGKLIQTLMHGKVPAGCVSDYPGEIINFGGARHVVERKDGKWHFYGEFIGKGGLVGKIIDGPNTPYGKVQRYVEQNYTKAEQDKIWLTLKNQMCCQANDFKDACAGCQSLCARGCAAFSSEDFDYTKFSLRDKAKAMEMDEEPKADGLQLKAAPETQKQKSGLRLGGRQYSVDMASELYRTENDFTEAMPADEFREKIKAESSAESYFPKGLSEKFMKAIAGKGTFNRTKLYRGIDAAEMDFLMENKYLQSNGSYNFQNQQGQTLADEDPGYALSYATGFAPKEIADKHYKDGQPSYLVEFLNSPNLNVSKNEVQESYTYDQIDQDYITRIFEIEYDPKTQKDMVRDVTEEMRAHLPDMGKGLAETAHGRPMFFRDKTTGTLVYAVQGADGWENGKYISEKDPSMTWNYEQMDSPVFSKHAPAMLGVSGNEADLEAMEVGPDGELVPEKKVQYNAEEEKYAEAQEKYRDKPLAGTEELYTYDFMKSLPDMKIVYAPSIADLYGQKGFTKQDVIQKGKSNAAKIGEQRGENIYAKNNYTGRDIRVTSKGIRHGLQGTNYRILTNARLGAIAGDLIKNAVPINELHPDTDDPNVNSTYAMAAYVQDENGHEYVAILTIDQRDESLVGIDLVDALHSINGRYRKSSRAGTKPQGFNPSTTAEISVADFLKVVNECFQSILSKDVYNALNKKGGERATGYYTGRRVYSAEDSDDEYRQTPGTEALDKLGIRLAGSKGKYHLAEQLLERDKAAKELMKATKKAEKKLKATKAEREFAAGIAAGIYEERDIPSSMNKDTVATLADYYAAEESFKANMLAEVRGRINAEYQDEAEELLANVDQFKKLSMLMLNERTPDRSFRAMFGPTQGKAIFDWLIRPVQMNEAAKTRWHQEQLDKVRKFEDSKGKTRALTRAESELTMLVMEGKAAAAAVADMEKKGLDAKGIRNAAENIRNGEDAADAAWEFGLKDKERELARNYARWMDTQEKLKSADSTIIENAAETYSKIFDEFYDGINDFLVAHGYEPIGYIKGYAPHMQPEETQSLLEKAFDKMGISLGNDKAQGLPASIAGETAYFKPNKRWDPYFLHRTGTQAEYDIEKAYQSYVGYLSDILFHTDDIMRVRNMERMIRKTYASDEIKENLDWIQEIRNSPSEERLGMLRDAGKIGKTTILSGSEVNDKLDEWEEEEFNALKEDRQYNNLVMWLSNYANILAGKQSFADRGWEYSLGRNSLNFANRLQAAFQRSLVAGSLTSALNQTAQLPMIKAELGDRWYYTALKDILTGQTRGFWKDSDFLTGKHGVDMLYTDNYDKFISALFKPSTAVDYIVSTTAVRGAFLKAIHQGQSYSEAMRTADDFGRRVMGSREKGTRPLAYESKGLFSRMIHMFQVEAANSWDHIASDLPYEIKEIARTQGKPKAARTLAALLVKALLSTFLLNRLTEETYGGTPAPFDIIGLALNFVASGQGMTTNQYLKTIIDNGLEKIGSDRLFGTEDADAEFDVGKGLEELGYNVMNDVPLLRNLAGLLGLGDQTVPLPGAGGELKDAFTAAGDLIKDGADGQTIENLIRAAAKLGAQFVPAGRQLTKTGEGIETVIRGGSYSKKGKLQYPVDSTEDQVRAVLFGKNATNAAQEHWASGGGTMSEEKTEMVTKLRGQGMTGAEAQDAAKTVKSFSGDDKRDQTVAYIDSLNITDSLKDEMYFYAGYKESTLDTTPWHAKGGSSGRGKTYSMADQTNLLVSPSARMNEQDRELWDMESHGGNVNLRTRKTIPVTRENIDTVKGWGMDSEVGDYMTVASQTYRDGDRAVVVTPILPDGSLMTQTELDTYMDSLRGSGSYADADDRGIILGVFDEGNWQQNLKDSDAFAERIHELHEEREEKRKTTGLKLPSAPQARPTSSGLKLQSAPAAKPSSAGLKLR